MFTIMIVDDNEQLQNEIGNLLLINGYSILKPKNFKDIAQIVKDDKPSSLDINLPNDDGFKICTEICSFSKVPIIFITSRNTNIDELMAITLGGDDFITKPYNTQILLARINALIKRAYPNDNNMDIIEHNGLTLNILSSTIEHNEKSIELTKNELKILYKNLSQEWQERIIHPLQIFNYDNKFYVTAYCELRDDIRHFEINRIKLNDK